MLLITSTHAGARQAAWAMDLKVRKGPIGGSSTWPVQCGRLPPAKELVLEIFLGGSHGEGAPKP